MALHHLRCLCVPITVVDVNKLTVILSPGSFLWSRILIEPIKNF